MLSMGIISYLTGAEKNRREIEDMRSEISEIRDELDTLREESVSETDITNIQSRLRELEGVGAEFSDSEWNALNALLDLEGYASYADIAEEINSSVNNARVLVNNLKDKVELDKKTEGRKKLYDVPESTRKDLLRYD